MKSLARLKQVTRRFHQIFSYGMLASAPLDSINLAVVGYASGHTFGAEGIISRVGRWFYPTITTRPYALGGMKVVLDPSDVSHLVIFAEVIRDQNYNLDSVPFEPDLILDCGGHIGLFTLQAANRYPCSRIIVFEPNPDNIEYIKKHVALNRLRIELIEAAVSRHNGQQWFRADCSMGGRLQDSREKDELSFSVRVVDLPALIKTMSPRKLVLKIDIEGEELNLFPALIPELPQRCAIFFETHHDKDSWNFVAENLTAAGFQVQQTRCRYPYADGFAARN